MIRLIPAERNLLQTLRRVRIATEGMAGFCNSRCVTRQEGHMTNSKDFDRDSIRHRFTGLFMAFGAARATTAEPVVTYGYASAPDSAQCPFIIKPSSHERVVIDAHRSDWM